MLIHSSQARLDDFEADVGLVGNQFNVAVSILNVGYMLAQLPSNMILTRVRPSIYLPCCVVIWSCVSAATASVTSFGSLIAVRFFLGIVEAPFFPGVCAPTLYSIFIGHRLTGQGLLHAFSMVHPLGARFENRSTLLRPRVGDGILRPDRSWHFRRPFGCQRLTRMAMAIHPRGCW